MNLHDIRDDIEHYMFWPAPPSEAWLQSLQGTAAAAAWGRAACPSWPVTVALAARVAPRAVLLTVVDVIDRLLPFIAEEPRLVAAEALAEVRDAEIRQDRLKALHEELTAFTFAFADTGEARSLLVASMLVVSGSVGLYHAPTLLLAYAPSLVSATVLVERAGLPGAPAPAELVALVCQHHAG